MLLLVIRHAIARDRADHRGPDEVRPLTSRGRREMKEAAKGLRRLVPRIDLLVTSPLTRAAQTAKIVAKAYGGIDAVECDALEPGRHPRELARWLSRLDEATVAVVGHEPHLSEAVAHLTGAGRTFMTLKKGGACLLEFDGAVAAGRARLVWAVTPSQLRRMK